MEITIFLAKFWGWFLVITSLIFLFRKKALWDEMMKVIEDRGFTLISGYLALVIGLITVILHNLWVSDWRVVITIFGWLSLLKGVARLGFPKAAQQSAMIFKEKTLIIQILLIIMFLLGAWLIKMS